jgi:hypothetical protein
MDCKYKEEEEDEEENKKVRKRSPRYGMNHGQVLYSIFDRIVNYVGQTHSLFEVEWKSGGIILLVSCVFSFHNITGI